MIIIPYRDQEISYSEVGNVWSVTMSGMTVDFRSLLQAKGFITKMIEFDNDTDRLQAMREFETGRRKDLQW